MDRAGSQADEARRPLPHAEQIFVNRALARSAGSTRHITRQIEDARLGRVEHALEAVASHVAVEDARPPGGIGADRKDRREHSAVCAQPLQIEGSEREIPVRDRARAGITSTTVRRLSEGIGLAQTDDTAVLERAVDDGHL